MSVTRVLPHKHCTGLHANVLCFKFCVLKLTVTTCSTSKPVRMLKKELRPRVRFRSSDLCELTCSCLKFTYLLPEEKKMSLVEDLGTVATVESDANERDLRLQRRRERERARRQSESAKQREERLRRWQERDRARRAAQTALTESTEQ